MNYILALDAGTTSNRAIIFDREGQLISLAQKEFNQYFPKPGWVEQDPTEISSTMLGVAAEAIAKSGVDRDDIASIGITNQRETTIIWDKKTGLPVHPAIVWQCRRTAPIADQLIEDGYGQLFQDKTGLVIDAYFSATKIKYILDQVPNLRTRAKNGEIAFGTVDSYLIYQLTKGEVHKTDPSNACRTMLYNIHQSQWDQEILDILDIPMEILPEVSPSKGLFGQTHQDFFGRKIPITGVLGDQQAALFGQACFEKSQAKNTYGTGAFVLMNTGDKPIKSKDGLLTSIAWEIDGKINYALEGSIFVAGSALQWLRDELGIMVKSSDSQAMALAVKDTKGVVVVPAFTGLGAPYWDPYARGAILGLSRGSNKNHIVRATLESIALLSRDVIQTMEKDADLKISSLKVDGGASQNDFLLQCQSDFLGAKVIRPECVETTALGASYMAGLGAGLYDSLDEISQLWKKDKSFEPKIEKNQLDEKLAQWQRAVRMVLNH